MRFPLHTGNLTHALLAVSSDLDFNGIPTQGDRIVETFDSAFVQGPH